MEKAREQFWEERERVYSPRISDETESPVTQFADFMSIVSREAFRQSIIEANCGEIPLDGPLVKHLNDYAMEEYKTVKSDAGNLMDGFDVESVCAHLGELSPRRKWWQIILSRNPKGSSLTENESFKGPPYSPSKDFEKLNDIDKTNFMTRLQRAIIDKVESQFLLFSRWSKRFPSAKWSIDRDMEAELRQAETEEQSFATARSPTKSLFRGKSARRSEDRDVGAELQQAERGGQLFSTPCSPTKSWFRGKTAEREEQS